MATKSTIFSRVKAALAGLKKEECHRAFADSWKNDDIQIFVGGKLKLEGDAAAQIIQTFRDSQRRVVRRGRYLGLVTLPSAVGSDELGDNIGEGTAGVCGDA
jgi:hypothetical protein